MRKFYAFLAACLLSMSTAWADYKTIYTLFDSNTGTLTYYYDYKSKCVSEGGEEYDPEVNRFIGYSKDVQKIVIDNTVSLCDMLKTTQNFFFSGAYDERFVNLTEIEGMRNLKTQNVTDMRQMFYGCSSLTSIDLSRLDTRKVKYMDAMFSNCSSLEELDLSYFWTHSVEQMSYMFDGCKALKKVNLSSFRTENVKFIDGMFSDCESLTELDLSLFDMRQVVDNYAMFTGCKKLKTIYCNDDLKTSDDLEGNDMFEDCVSLVGEYGTTFDPNHTNIEYARRDTKDGKKGYFTSKPETFVVLDENNNFLYYWCGVGRKILFPKSLPAPLQITDDDMEERYVNQVEEVYFNLTMGNSDFKHAKDLMPRNANHIVKPFKAAKKVTGLEHINTSVLTDWEMMFYYMNITEVDLTKVDMAPITDVTDMFAGCENLVTIYCNEDWNERKEWKIWVGDGRMFQDCYKLKGGNGTTYDADHQGFSYAHPDKAGNPGYFTATKILDPEAYAAFDEQIRTLTYYYDKNRAEYDATILLPWTDKDFYEAHKTDIGRILIDESFKNAPLKSTQGLFHYTSNGSYSGLPYVGEIDGLENLDTKTMTNLMWLFAGMEGMVEFDLTKMDLSDIIAAPGMFVYCSNLKKIICDADLSGIEDGYQMFYGCENLVGGLGTKCDGESIVSQAYARPDEEDNPGYFTSSKTGLKSIQHAGLGMQKVLRDGVLLIEKNGKLFNAQGAEVK